MQLRKYIFLLIFGCSISTCFGQISEREREKLNVILDRAIKPKFFPDSTALYTGQIHIIVDKLRKYLPVINSTDTALTNKLHILEALTRYVYRPLMMKMKRIHLVIPIAITDRPEDSSSFGRWSEPILAHCLKTVLQSNLHAVFSLFI